MIFFLDQVYIHDLTSPCFSSVTVYVGFTDVSTDGVIRDVAVSKFV
ncbi:hypothetical protein MESS2_p120024 [Mesorhizobium metallidurans STM 2683]|uniref:Uncharacterized protein n=1 Tax=Mesorhizobium metallidurans STM 2683 TaxID=1297569 RepID=M5EZE5_9HYPH|nr:hypothetical protein MESS2_p120024 [Mesorhizobium metallidurans STM 2683]